MLSLLVFAGAFLVLHLGISGTSLRRVLVDRLGERGFRGVFSGLAIVLLFELCRAYVQAPTVWLWVAPIGLRLALTLVMLPAILLLVLAMWPKPAALRVRGAPASGVHRITRHPIMVAICLWSVVHLLGRGELGAEIFFATFLINAGLGMPLMDHKLRQRDPGGWAGVYATTSMVPFEAIMSRRNTLSLKEIGIFGPLVGVAVWAIVLWGHHYLFNATPIPLPM